MLFEISQAVREALQMHRLLGHPVAVWRDGAVQWIAPEDIPIDLATPLPERE